MSNFPDKKYKIIYADPPWTYDDKLTGGKVWGGLDKHYPQMTNEELKALPINQIMDDDCILFMWCTWPKIKDGLDVIESWGFEYKTAAFVWFKTFNGRTHRGMGRWTRSNSEYVLLARKNKVSRKSARISQIIQSIEDFDFMPETIKQEIMGHSKKPDTVRKKIIELVGDLPRIELFARTKVHGWDVWGNDEKLKLEPLEFYQ